MGVSSGRGEAGHDTGGRKVQRVWVEERSLRGAGELALKWWEWDVHMKGSIFKKPCSSIFAPKLKVFARAHSAPQS
jgi:hypothetical protein